MMTCARANTPKAHPFPCHSPSILCRPTVPWACTLCTSRTRHQAWAKPKKKRKKKEKCAASAWVPIPLHLPTARFSDGTASMARDFIIVISEPRLQTAGACIYDVCLLLCPVSPSFLLSSPANPSLEHTSCAEFGPRLTTDPVPIYIHTYLPIHLNSPDQRRRQRQPVMLSRTLVIQGRSLRVRCDRRDPPPVTLPYWLIRCGGKGKDCRWVLMVLTWVQAWVLDRTCCLPIISHILGNITV